ncbi:NifU family protein [Fulvivirga maritima]|uniref:NifU family protein n=1 Tax=Fulvivirga maritima TaxID=2904247 RepID=UPI001F2F2CC9|nr:NifU family protein [Fulvivirga maritima]UII28549.1 NifU family protein [Fulvivirga maritima]
METKVKNDNQKVVNLYLEANPNPNSMKFVANYMLVPEGTSYDFPDVESTENAPLAKELFGFEYVDRVFYMSNFITITKKEEVEWIEIKDALKQHIKDYIESGREVITKLMPEEQYDESDSETVKKIKGILDEYIKPAVEQDGGAISFHSYENGIVKVLLQGSCSGCPSSTVTLKAGIENLLKRMLPEIEGVEAEGI